MLALKNFYRDELIYISLHLLHHELDGFKVENGHALARNC